MVWCRLNGGAEVLVSPLGDATPGRPVTLSLRPEKIILTDDPATGLVGHVTDCVYLGTDTTYRIALENGPEVVARVQNSITEWDGLAVGDGITVVIVPGGARILTD
jgi:spermidine/putrescine transport system ATP-binding protein